MDSKLLNNFEGPNLCTQCGKCCRKGGPLLHLDDMPLVHEGHICLSNLVTLRQGELAYNAVQNCLAPLTEEAIKIAGTNEQGAAWHCVLHLPNNGGCGLHPLRPVQCAALLCSDTTKLAAMYEQNRATRTELLIHHASWLELVKAHEEQCSLNILAELATTYEENVQDIINMVHYDLAFRELCVEKANIPVNMLDCILGRNLTHFIASFGLKLVNHVGEYNILRVGKCFYINR